MADCSWNSTVSQFGFAAMMGAAEPYSRRRIAYKVGPERYSFARLEREYGTADASCKAAFRFHLRDLRRLHAAMHFPDVIDTGHETVPGEEAFLIMLKRPAACQKSRLVAPQLSSCASPVCTWRLRAAQHSQTCGPRRWSPGRLAVSTSDRGNKLSGSGPGHSSLDSLPPGLAYPATFANLAWPCGRSPCALCRIFNATAHHVYGVFEHLRDERSLEAWAPHFEHFAKAIHRGGRRSRRSCRFYPMPLKNCIGLIDGSNQYCDKPGRYQGILYNGHKRAHLVKWQGIMLPNGIMPMPFGPINGRHHDAFMLDRSRVVPVMRRACRRAGRTYQLYGDPAYPLSPWLGAPFPSDGLISGQEARFNKTMSAARIAVEWGFGKIKTNWSYLDFKKGMKPYQSDLQKFWPVAQILTNCHTCIYGSQTSNYFNVMPPPLEVYLAMGSNLPVYR